VYVLKRSPIKRKPPTFTKQSTETLPLEELPQKTYSQAKPLQRQPLKKAVSKRISPISEKRKAQLLDYKVLRKDFLVQYPTCAAKILGCLREATEIHHMKGRENNLLNETQYWLPICRSCHTWITEHSKEAIERGWSISRLNKTT